MQNLYTFRWNFHQNSTWTCILDDLISIIFWWMHSNESSFTQRNHFVIKCESCKFTLTFRNVRMVFLVQPLSHALFSHASPPIHSINLTEAFHWHTAIQIFSPYPARQSRLSRRQSSLKRAYIVCTSNVFVNGALRTSLLKVGASVKRADLTLSCL